MIHYTMSITMHLLHSISISLISTKYGSEDLSIWRAISDSATRQLRSTNLSVMAIVIISILLRTAASR